MIARGAPAATRERLSVVLAPCDGEPASFTVTPKEKLPLTEGVPEIIPVAGARLSPAGRAPDVMDQVYGAVPPLACKG